MKTQKIIYFSYHSYPLRQGPSGAPVTFEGLGFSISEISIFLSISLLLLRQREASQFHISLSLAFITEYTAEVSFCKSSSFIESETTTKIVSLGICLFWILIISL